MDTNNPGAGRFIVQRYQDDEWTDTIHTAEVDGIYGTLTSFLVKLVSAAGHHRGVLHRLIVTDGKVVFTLAEVARKSGDDTTTVRPNPN